MQLRLAIVLLKRTVLEQYTEMSTAFVEERLLWRNKYDARTAADTDYAASSTIPRLNDPSTLAVISRRRAIDLISYECIVDLSGTPEDAKKADYHTFGISLALCRTVERRRIESA